MSLCVIGDPAGNRTRDSTLRGLRLKPLDHRAAGTIKA